MDIFKIAQVCFIGFALVANLFAGGAKESKGQAVNGLANWDYRYDIKDSKPGRYNLIIEGKDKAGNISIAGPFNIWIDPKSDIPVVAVNNPVADMRVGTNLNIVGTCVDDVAVDHVEIQLDNQAPITAKGKEYWSWYLPVKDIPDGKHSLTVRGFDNKGNPSLPVSVSFFLDKLKPDIAIVSHANGFLASGTVRLLGTIKDANGIDTLEISSDGGKTFMPSPLNNGQDPTVVDFSYEIDTRKLPDGPQVYWMRSKAKTGSIGVTAFLLSVANQPPVISILHPLSTESVFGLATIAGMVHSTVGIKEFGWSYDGKTGVISLVPGDPYFSHQFDFTMAKDKSALVSWYAIDASGNRSELKYPVNLNPEADLPVLELLDLKDKAVTGQDLTVAVHVSDNDGVKAVHFTIDGKAEQSQPMAESGLLRLDNLPAGPHKLSFQAEDSHGILGKTVEVSITVIGSGPRIRFDTLRPGRSPTGFVPDLLAGQSAEMPFANGITILQDASNQITGTITLANPLKSAEFSLDAKTWLPVTLKSGSDPLVKNFEISLPTTIGFGLVSLTVRVRDSADLPATFSGFLLVLDYRQVNTAPAIVFHDSRLVDGVMRLEPGKDLVGRFVGARPVSVRIQPPSNLIAVELKGTAMIVRALQDGVTPPLKLVVSTAEKHEISSADLVFRTDFQAPQLSMAAPATATRVKDNLDVNLAASDAGGLASADYSLDAGKNWQSLILPVNAAKAIIKQTISLAGLPDGPLPVLVRVRDKAGNEARSSALVVKAQKPLAVSLETAPVNIDGPVLFWGHVSDSDQLNTLEYQLGSSGWMPLVVSHGSFALSADLPPGAGATLPLVVRAISRSGVETLVNRTITLDAGVVADIPAPGPDAGKKPAAAKPKIRILSPSDPEAAAGPMAVVLALDDWAPGYKRFSWNLEGQKSTSALPIPASGMVLFNVDFAAVKGNQASGTLILEGDGNTRESLSFKVKVDNAAIRPVANTVALDETGLNMAVFAHGETGIQEIRYSLDGKAEAQLAVSDAGLVNLTDLPPGSHKLSVWAVDKSGSSGPKAEIPLVIPGLLPVVRPESARATGASQPWIAGMDLVLDKGSRVVFSVQDAGRVKDLQASLNGAPPQKLTIRGSGVEAKSDLALPLNLPWGINLINVSGIDSTGNAFSSQTFFYRIAADSPTSSATTGKIFGPAVLFDTSVLDDSQTIHLSPDLTLQACFSGRPIAKVALDPPTGDFQADFSGQLITVKGLNSAVRPQIRIVVTDIDGDTWRSDPFNLAWNPQTPQIELIDLPDGTWLLDNLKLQGSVSSGVSLNSLEYAFGDGAFTQVTTKNRKDKPLVVDFTADIKLADQPDGALILNLRATDQFGNTSLLRRVFSKDSQPPGITIIAPPDQESVNGLTSVIGLIQDTGRVKSLEFSADNKTWIPLENADLFSYDLDFGKNTPGAKFYFRARDAAGNSALITPSFNIDQERDKPVITIQTPLEGEVLRNDFKVAGLCFDDDGVKAIYYRLDYKGGASGAVPRSLPPGFFPGKGFGSGPTAATKASPNTPATFSASQLASFTRVEAKNSFTIPFNLLEVGDNDHKIEIVAEDINGTYGDIVTTSFRISTAEPTSLIVAPEPALTVQGIVQVQGKAEDKNGIASVWLSFDNGTSFVAAQGAESWSYPLDSTTLRDGTHVVVIKTIDKYDTEGLYTTLLNIDNTPPVLHLDTPEDGAELSGNLSLSGRITDNIGIAGVHLSLVPADAPVNGRKDNLELDLDFKTVLQQQIDISRLATGWYSLRIEARDHANNRNWIARNIQVVNQTQDDKIELVYPLEGETMQGNFTLSGRLFSSRSMPANITLVLNGKTLGDFPVGRSGYFNIPLGPEQCSDGPVAIEVQANMNPAAALVHSSKRQFSYGSTGYWVRFDQIQTGDFLTKRPFIRGTSGYYLPAVPKESADYPAYQKQLETHRIDRIQISFDHGNSWLWVGNAADWLYRIETQNYPDGELFLLVRSIGIDGGMSIARATMVIDKTPPVITLLKPGEESSFNDRIDLVGTASDNFDLESVTVDLRQGDKANYKVPSFIQGLYLDGHFLGATTWEAGLGLTFFDDNVKLQVQFGQAPPGDRFDGYVIGAKIIANLAYLPFSFLFGPDWDFFSMSFGVGAQFDYFTMSGAEFNFNQTGVVLGSALLQWEFARFHFSDLTVFRNISLYAEGQLWFVSSDVQAGVFFKTTFGARLSIF